MRGFLVLFLSLLFSGAAAHVQHEGYNYYAQALQGDLSGAGAALKAEGDQTLYDKFKARFLKRKDGLPLDKIEDAGVRAVAAAYQDYWRAALLTPEKGPQLEAELIATLGEIIDRHDTAREGHANDFVSEAEFALLQNDATDAKITIEAATIRLLPWIEERGLQALTGRTPPLLELMLWKETSRVETEVELTDGTVTVPIVYLKNFISGGWAYFATFERSRAGGWTKADGIYVVDDAYPDREAESFTISYLKHEARHFVDATRYPNISSADREYRAKLTELVYAQKSMTHLLGSFALHGAKVDVPHPLANWHVMRDLEARLFDSVAPAEWWKTVDGERVRAAALALLEAHTARLDAEGRAATEGVIRI